MSTAELEQAIVALYNPQVAPEVKLQAQSFLEQLSQSPDGWKVFVQKLFESNSTQVAFVCLNVIRQVLLHRYLTLDPNDRTQLKQALLTYAQQYIGPATPPEIGNKLAEVFVLIFKNEFPTEWPSFFTDLAAALLIPRRGSTPSPTGGVDLDPALVQMYLAILREVDTEVVSNELNRSMTDLAHNRALKDAMRDTGSVAHLVDVCYNLLLQYNGSHPDISNSCLKVLRPYIDWIDIRLIVNDKVFPLLLNLLQNPRLQANAIGCILEVVEKGMDPPTKVLLLREINIRAILDGFSASSPKAMETFAKLVNTIGVELLSSVDQLPPELEGTVAEIFNSSLVHMFRCLNDEYDDTSVCVVEFVGKYVRFLDATRRKRGAQFSADQIEHLKTLVQILRNKMKYDPSFNFSNKGQDEVDFIEYRKQLDGLFRSIASLHPQLAAEFVATLVAQIDSLNDPLEMESVVHLYNLIGDGGAATSNTFIADLLNHLSLSKIFNFTQPPELTGQFFECANRYARCIADRADLLPRLLQLWISERGVMHPDIRARSERCSLFCGFVKTLKQALQLYLPDLVERLKPAIEFHAPLFRRDDEGNTDVVDSVTGLTIDEQLHLFESLGLLVGLNSQQEGSKAGHFLATLVTPLVETLLMILNKQLYKQDSAYQPVNTKWICNLIGAVGTFSKGFPVNLQNQQTAAVQYFSGTVPIVLDALQALPSNDEVRSRVLFYTHRMITCLGAAQMLPYFPRITQLMLTNSNLRQTIDFIIMLNQALVSFKEQAAAFLDQSLMDILLYVMGLVTQAERGATSQSEDAREVLEVKRHFFMILSTVATNNLINVFTTARNIVHLNGILQALLQGLTIMADPNIQKLASATLVAMVENWTRVDGGLPGFDEFVYKQLLKTVFEVISSPEFNLADARSGVEVMHELGLLIKGLHKNRALECEQYLQMVLLPSLNCPPDMAAQLVDRMRQAPEKQFGPILREFIKARRGV